MTLVTSSTSKPDNTPRQQISAGDNRTRWQRLRHRRGGEGEPQ